ASRGGDAGPRAAGAARALRGRPRGPARGRSRDGPTGQRSAFVLSSRAMTKPALVVCSALLVLACTKQEVDTTPPEPAPPEPVVAEPEPEPEPGPEPQPEAQPTQQARPCDDQRGAAA